MKYLKLSLCFIFCFCCFNNSLLSQNNYKLLFVEAKYDKIENLSKQMLDSDNSSIDDFYWHAFILHEKGELAQSIDILEKGHSKFTTSDILKRQLADYYYELGDYFHAKEYLVEFTNDFSCAIKLCEIHEINSDYNEALKLLLSLSKTYKNNILCIKHLAYNYYKLEKFDEAELYYLIAHDIYPQDQSVAAKLVNIYNSKDSYKQSIKISNIILKQDSLNTAFLKYAGYAYLKEDNYTKALTLFKKLYTKGDSSAYVLKHLGVAELKLEMYEEAQKHLYQSYLKDSSDYQVCYFLGTSYINTENKNEGLLYLNKADKGLQPKQSTQIAIYHAKASLYKEMKVFDKAIDLYIDAYKLEANPRDLFYIASVYKNDVKNNKKALEYYNFFLKNIESEKEEESSNPSPAVSSGITYKEIAERNIEEIKKELFFNK